MKRLITASFLISIWASHAGGGRVYAADPTTADCLAANEKSISLRNQHKLRDARTSLLICSAATCPADIRNECIRRVGEVNASMPTIVFATKDGADNDLSAVQVMMDGEALVERLQGTALSIDPGTHIFTFTTAGQPAVHKELVILEGQKDRRERIVFGMSRPLGPSIVQSNASQSMVGGSATTAPPTPGWWHSNPKRLGAIAVAGLGVVGLGLGIGFGLAASSRHDDAARICPGQCADQTGWNEARSAGNISTVAMVVGVAGLAGGAALWFLSKKDLDKASSAQVTVGLGSVELKGTW